MFLCVRIDYVIFVYVYVVSYYVYADRPRAGLCTFETEKAQYRYGGVKIAHMLFNVNCMLKSVLIEYFPCIEFSSYSYTLHSIVFFFVKFLNRERYPNKCYK